MHCPKCGEVINNGDILCSKCGYPVAFMSGSNTSENRQAQVQVQDYIEYKEPVPNSPVLAYKAPSPKQEKKEAKPTQEKYENGESKKAVFSLKFIVPVIIGTLVLVGILIGIFDIVKSKIKEAQELKTREEVKTYKLEFNNFMYEIPNEYSYQKNNTTATLFLSKDDLSITIQTIDATFQSIKSSKASLKSYFQSKGYNVGEVKEINIKNSTYLTLDAKKKNKSYLLAVTKATQSKCFGVSINKDSIDELENISSIISSAEYQNKNTEQNIDFDFKEVIK